MRNVSKIMILVLLALMPMWVEAASKQPEVTRKYKNTPLIEVFQGLEKKTKYQILYDPNEVDETKLITASFKQTRLATIVKRVCGKGYDVKTITKTKTITITKKPEAQPQQRQSQPQRQQAQVLSPVTTTIAATSEQREQNIDSIRQTIHLQTVVHVDSTMQVNTRKVKQPAENQPEPKYSHCSHRIIAGAGVGYGEVIKHGSVAALGDVNYAFFFHDNWGVSAGLGVDYYRSQRLYSEDYVVKGYQDTDTEPEADLQVSDKDMKEAYNLLTVNMPIMIQMEYPLPNSKNTPLWIYASAGPRIGYPVVHDRLLEGNRTMKGYYEKWDLTLENMHEYGSVAVNEKNSFPVKALTIAPHAEVGVAIGVKENLTVGVGAYGNVSVWNEGDYLPWQVGAKVSVRWRKNVKPQPLPTVYETVIVKDTTWTYSERVDTIRTMVYDTIMHPAAQAIAKVMERSIIWFDLDKTIPKLDPIDMLDEIAAILVENPEQRIEVNGHTCDLGGRAYNENLSMRRAKAVVKLLIEKGVRPEQMEVHAYANSKPYYSKVHDRYLDRRVEIVPIINENVNENVNEN